MRMRKLILIVIVVALVGCQQQIQEPKKVWGQGELSEKWKGFFGDDNISRFNFVQTQSINRIGQAVAELAERVRKLEEPIDVNDVVIDASDN